MSENQALAPMESFQQKVKNKIRDDFASMIPDEALEAMVKNAIDDAFFKPRYVRDDSSWNPKVSEKPPLIVELAVTQAASILESEIRKWIAENREAVEKALRETFEKSAGEVLM